VKEDLFVEEELLIILKRFKNNEAPGADSMVNEFVFLDGFCEARDQLLKIMNMVWKMRKYPGILRKLQLNP